MVTLSRFVTNMMQSTMTQQEGEQMLMVTMQRSATAHFETMVWKNQHSVDGKRVTLGIFVTNMM